MVSLLPRSLRRVTTAALSCCLVLYTGCGAKLPLQRVSVGDAERPVRPPGTVLFVLTAAEVQTLANGKTRSTGYFLNEFYDAYAAVTGAGYQVMIATPDGRPAVVDPESFEEDYWRDHPEALARARALVGELPELRRPLTLDEARRRVDELQGLVVPGGQGVMIDLLDNPALHELVLALGRTDRPVGLVCHAPAVLARLPAQGNPFAGRLVTSVSGMEEWYIETFVMRGKAIERQIGDQLADRGYRYDSGRPGKPHAVRDCNLVTSQNPFSGPPFARELLAALDDWRRGGRCVEVPRGR